MLTREQLAEKGFEPDGNGGFRYAAWRPRRRAPGGSVRAALPADDPADTAELERPAVSQAGEGDADQGAVSARFVAVYTVYSCRPCDGDNVVTKFYTDGLRHLGLIPEDTPEDLETRVRACKARHKAEERTELEIFERIDG